MNRETFSFDKNTSYQPSHTEATEDGVTVHGETEHWDKYEDRRPEELTPEITPESEEK